MSRLAATVAAFLLTVSSAAGQRNAPPHLEARPNLSPGEVQRLFEAYAVVQAQEMLALSDAQYPQFITRLKALHEIRRRAQRERAVVLQELIRLTGGPGRDAAARTSAGNEAQIRDRVRQLDELDERTAAEVRQSYQAIDQILDVRQQARFRVFEEQMERRKIELLMKARQARALPPRRR
jgi:hypothetical protein